MLVPSLMEGILVSVPFGIFGEGDGTHYVCCIRSRWNVEVTNDGTVSSPCRFVRFSFGFHNPVFQVGVGDVVVT